MNLVESKNFEIWISVPLNKAEFCEKHFLFTFMYSEKCFNGKLLELQT